MCPPYPSPKSSPTNDTRDVLGGSAGVKEAYLYFFSYQLSLYTEKSLF